MANKCHNTLLARLANGYEAPTYSSVTLTSSSNPRPISDSIFRASSTLTSLSIHNNIFNSVLLTSCTLTNCILHHSILFDCSLKNTAVKHCQVIKAPLALRRFAPEIRAIIFEHVIEEEGKDGKIPALVKALRGDQVLYREAIEVLYKKGAVPMSFMQNMNPADVQLVTRLVIDPVYDRDALGDHEVVLGHAANVQELDLPWSKRRGDHDTFIARFVHLSICMMRLQSVKRVSVMYPCTFGWWSNPRDVPRVYEKFIDVWFGSSANTARSVRYNGCFANRVLEAKDGTHWARLACPRNEAGGN